MKAYIHYHNGTLQAAYVEPTVGSKYIASKVRPCKTCKTPSNMLVKVGEVTLSPDDTTKLCTTFPVLRYHCHKCD